MDNRSLDALVAEKVMGWTFKKPGIGSPWWALSDDTFVARAKGKNAWSPSTRIDHSWQVVEKMRERGFDFELTQCHQEPESIAIFFKCQSDKGIREDAATMPQAICLAALKSSRIEGRSGK